MVQLKYFGDNRDYFKYDLITSIFEANLLERYVFIPMLTDHRNDNEGRKTPMYNGDKSINLYEFLQTCKNKSLDHWETWLSPYVIQYQTVKPVDQKYFRDDFRTDYFNQFKSLMNTSNTLVFVDPDTGLQTGKPSYRKKMGPAKYILNNELHSLFSWLHTESTLMIYQHLPRDKRRHIEAIQKKLLQVQSVCNNALTCAYREDDLAFIFVAKSKDMFNQLLSFLSRYQEKSQHKYKNIVQL